MTVYKFQAASILLCTALLVPLSVGQEFVTTPEHFGAVGDGKANDWVPIGSAIASCSSQLNPCRVLLAGKYLSGPISLNRSFVTLDVRGSLSMLPKHEYPGDHHGAFISNSVGDQPACKIVGAGYRVCLSGIEITGGGTISSSSPWSWWLCKLTGCPRPHLVVLTQVHRLRIHDITLKDAPNHNIETDSSVNVRIDNIRVLAPNFSPNTDGVNFYGGFDQMLSNSMITNGDDCVSVVPIGLDRLDWCAINPEKLPCRGGNVIVRNVSCFGGHGISIGGVRHGSVVNVTFENMTATGGPTQGKYSTGGVRIKSYPNSSGLVSHITYRDIVLDSVYLPLQLLGHYCPWPCKTPDGSTSVQFSNITFQNIRGSGKQRDVVGIFSCSPLAPCQDISLVNVTLSGTNARSPGKILCENVPSVSFEQSDPSACSSSENDDAYYV